jgi:hypothetical protein
MRPRTKADTHFAAMNATANLSAYFERGSTYGEPNSAQATARVGGLEIRQGRNPHRRTP